MRHAPLPVLCFLAAACTATMEIAGVGPSDDDSSPAGDDDDTTPIGDDDDITDDDSSPGDDDVPPEGMEDLYLYLFAVGAEHRPEGRWSVAWASLGDPPEKARGWDDGPCSVPEAAARGEPTYYDMGESVLIRQAEGDWRMELPRYVWKGTPYYYKDAADPPRGIPGEGDLDLSWSGGVDLSAWTLPGAVPTVPPFAVDRPSLGEGATELVLDGGTELGFVWEPLGDDYVEIAFSFPDSTGTSVVEVYCYPADTGSFAIPTEFTSLAPLDTAGTAWIRRYRDRSEPGNDEQPELALWVGRQVDWTVRFRPAGDSTDPSGTP